MLIALIADIHGNALALEACLAEARRLNVERYVFLGDLVGYGAEPNQVVARIRDLSGAVVIRGNHDHAIGTTGEHMNSAAAAAIEWTRGALTADHRHWLAQLPMHVHEGDLLFVHASADRPHNWSYVTDGDMARASLAATDAAVTFVGHVHVPALYCISTTAKLIAHRPVSNVELPLSAMRRWLAVIGSCGQPRDNNPAAAFATYDTERRSITFRRAPYDAEAACQRIRAAGLPEVLAVRLLVGR